MKVKDWLDVLSSKSDRESLCSEFNFEDGSEIRVGPSEVLEILVLWRGGYSSGSEIVRLINEIWGINLDTMTRVSGKKD